MRLFVLTALAMLAFSELQLLPSAFAYEAFSDEQLLPSALADLAVLQSPA